MFFNFHSSRVLYLVRGSVASDSENVDQLVKLYPFVIAYLSHYIALYFSVFTSMNVNIIHMTVEDGDGDACKKKETKYGGFILERMGILMLVTGKF